MNIQRRRALGWTAAAAGGVLGARLARAQAPQPSAAAAREDAPLQIEGQSLPRRLTLQGVDLVLNGTGIRSVAWFKGYVAALYVRQRVDSAAALLAQAAPMRLQLILLHAVPAEELAKAVDKGVRRNTPPDDLPALETALAAFLARVRSVGEVRLGDRVDLDWVLASGLQLSVNGGARGGPVGDEALYRAVLRSFVGDRPYDPRLKAGLLGRPLP